MRRITFIFAMLLLAVITINAANDSKKPKENTSKSMISGIVTDKVTGEPLTGVEVKIVGSDIKQYTDFEGKFVIKDVPAGSHAIMVNLISYNGLVENVSTETGNAANLLIKMNSVEK
jgi:hypothetical protein